jgi:putative transcriptional regulator
MTKLGKALIQAAKEARAIARGEMDSRTYRVHIPPEIDVKRLREKLQMTQPEFAARFGFKLATLRDWEQKRSLPVEHARAYLLTIQKEPKAVSRALRPAHRAARKSKQPALVA